MSINVQATRTPALTTPESRETPPEAALATVLLRPSRGWLSINVREIWAFRDLLLVLAGRDIKLRYRQTALGVIWVVLQPLVAAGIFSLVFGAIAKLPSGHVPYFLFAYVGMMAWNAFNTTLSKSSLCLIGNVQLISKIYFPRLVLPLSTAPSALVDFAVSFCLLLCLLPVYHIALSPAVLLLPVFLLLTLLLALGWGLIAAALTASYRDVQFVMPVLLQFVLYATPFAYAVSAVPHKLRLLFMINPLSNLVEGFRWSLIHSGHINAAWFAASAAQCIAIFVFGLFAFRRMERSFADVI